MKDAVSLYIHIPFCESKCFYCAFNSFCSTDEEKEKYIDALCKEIEKRKVARPVSTIYIGGGTPSVLNEEQIERIVRAVFDNFDVFENAEFTIEANPNSITESLLRKWKELRVNRLSIGVQSLSDTSLKKIGRLHNKKMALDGVKLARKFFNNVSCDLIVGLENETGKDLCKYAKMLLELKVKHISCYLLEVYNNTKLGKMVENEKYSPLNDQQIISAFNKLCNYLQDCGMRRYEISNFAFSGFESAHNLNYWLRGDYLGFGISAHSFFEGNRTENANNLKDYIDGKISQEKLTEKEENEEKIMLGLRCCLGVDLSSLKNYDLKKNPYFEQYINQGVLQLEENRAFLNPLFYHISNTIISNLLPD